jgi:hypothetical protein
MSIFLWIFLSLLSFSKASENPAYAASGYNLQSLFSKIYSLIKQNPRALVSPTELSQIRYCYCEFPLKTFEEIDRIGSKTFIRYFHMLIGTGNYDDYKKKTHKSILKTRKEDISSIFNRFSIKLTNILFHYYDFASNSSVLSYKRRMINLTISILKRMDCSEKIVQINFFPYTGTSISTREYIETLRDLVKILEEDGVKGFKNSYFNLVRLFLNHNGVMPDDTKGKSRINSLIFSCCYHCRLMQRFGFNGLDEIRAPPLMLAFLFRLIYFKDTPEFLFSVCWSNSIVGEIVRQLRVSPVSRILSSYGFEDHSCLESLISKVSGVISGKVLWPLNVYLKLLRYSNWISATSSS